jgi:hypothetical protein
MHITWITAALARRIPRRSRRQSRVVLLHSEARSRTIGIAWATMRNASWQFVGFLMLIGFVGVYPWLIALTVAAFGLTYWAVSRALE